MRIFRDRTEAGEVLASMLPDLGDRTPIVLALPRGGLPVAVPVARALGAPLDVIVSRKLGAPGQPELGFGAVAEGGGRYVNRDTVRLLALSESRIAEVEAAERRELARRVEKYRGGKRLPSLEGRTVVLVDDGIATGGTVRAALESLRDLHPKRIVLAVPVAPAETARELREEVDELVCPEEPESLWAIGAWYEDFSQLRDEEVISWLQVAAPSEEHAPP
ncbi:phosphoribosyltransferase [Vulgatibacter incomptus]|uniref:Phosphoribosyl transferase domain protein n=1 Tax=Vulgatibacter incomptus TaxID=1391653 RepID=A0A0K1PDR7_9BACT|nr:phosphoribosyltransferase [Vulgatibacter incomptus]AKU91249.1 Phosphoribosyl transferase domain protein [Vulgatibacter incomptus]